MSFQIEWDNPECTLLRYTVSGHWTWEEFYSARVEGRQMIDQVDADRIDAIIDLRYGSLFPQNALFHFRQLPGEVPPKLDNGVVVIVQNNLFVSTMIEVMRRINPHAMRNFYSARSLEQARAQIHEAHLRDYVLLTH